MRDLTISSDCPSGHPAAAHLLRSLRLSVINHSISQQDNRVVSLAHLNHCRTLTDSGISEHLACSNALVVDHPLDYHLIDGRFHIRGRGGFTITLPLTVIRYKPSIISDIGIKFFQFFRQYCFFYKPLAKNKVDFFG